MRAKFEADINPNLTDPTTRREAMYVAIVESVTRQQARYIALVTSDKVTLIDDNGDMFETERHYYNIDYLIVEMPDQITITFKNELE